MGFLDWIKQRKEGAERKTLGRKYGHDAIGAPGAAIRHHEKLAELKTGKCSAPEKAAGKTTQRPRPSWER